MPLVSIILPTRNRAGYLLRRSIESVLAQTFKDFELIVVDDASTDDTPKLLASYTDPRVRVVRRGESTGVAAVRNAGVREARGELIAFQDDDDVWVARKLERQVDALRNAAPDVGLCLCGYLRWSPWHSVYVGGEAYFSRLDFRWGQPLGVDYSLVATPSWLVRRSVLDQAGAFDERLRTWEDLDMAMRLQSLCRFIHVDEPLYVQDHVLGSRLMQQFQLFVVSTRVILEKHGHRWAGQRELDFLHSYTLGRLELQYGNLAEARRWLWRALKLRPRSVRTWANLVGSYLGQDLHRRVSSRMRRLLRRPVWWLSNDPALVRK